MPISDIGTFNSNSRAASHENQLKDSTELSSIDSRFNPFETKRKGVKKVA